MEIPPSNERAAPQPSGIEKFTVGALRGAIFSGFIIGALETAEFAGVLNASYDAELFAAAVVIVAAGVSEAKR